MFSYIQPLLFLCPSGSRSVSKHDFFWSPAWTRRLFQAARAQSRGPGAHSDQQRIRYCRCVLCRPAPQECAGFPRVHAPCVVCVWPAALHSPAGDHLIQCEQLPDVCQTIEVTTENEEQTVSSSHSYPLQISPVSSCCGETPHTQTHPLNRSMLRGTKKKAQIMHLQAPDHMGTSFTSLWFQYRGLAFLNSIWSAVYVLPEQ